MARMRYVIKNPTRGYFNEMYVTATRAVTLNGRVIGHEQTWRPKFDGMQHAHAAQFNTKHDAEALMSKAKPGEPDFGAPESFAGCIVEPNTSEHEPDDQA